MSSADWGSRALGVKFCLGLDGRRMDRATHDTRPAGPITIYTRRGRTPGFRSRQARHGGLEEGKRTLAFPPVRHVLHELKLQFRDGDIFYCSLVCKGRSGVRDGFARRLCERRNPTSFPHLGGIGSGSRAGRSQEPAMIKSWQLRIKRDEQKCLATCVYTFIGTIEDCPL